MNKKKSLQNNYHMKKSGYQRAHFERCNLLTSSKLFARRFNLWSSRQLSISLTRAKWLWARLKCWSLERQDKPCREKKAQLLTLQYYWENMVYQSVFYHFLPKENLLSRSWPNLNIAEVPFAKHPASRHHPFHITLVFMSWLLSMSSFWSLLQDARSPAQERNGTMLVDRRRLFLKRNIRTETTKTVKTSQESFVQGYRSVTIVNITVSSQLRYRLQFQISNWMVEGRLSTYC